MIKTIDISALFGPESSAHNTIDEEILNAANTMGFITISGFPGAEQLKDDRRSELLKIFTIPDTVKRRLMRHAFAAENSNIYHGWYPLQNGAQSYKEGIDIGPDLVRKNNVDDVSDPLCEATPLPEEDLVPGWYDSAREYYLNMEATGHALMESIARSLGLDEHFFDQAFERGISTLRLAHYPLRTEESMQGDEPEKFTVKVDGEQYWIIGAPHFDTGFITLLAQDAVAGVQAQTLDKQWITVPPIESTLAVNFGRLLAHWTGGRIRATLHRVLCLGGERYSIPFFYQPRIDAEIAPLPIPDCGKDFKPFLYGDYLWDTTSQFVEASGMAHHRTPRGDYTPPILD